LEENVAAVTETRSTMEARAADARSGRSACLSRLEEPTGLLDVTAIASSARSYHDGLY